MRERLWVALDVETPKEADGLLERLAGAALPEKIGAKIRNAQLEKIPYMLILGPQEVETRTVALRSRTQADVGKKTIEELTAMLREEQDRRGA